MNPLDLVFSGGAGGLSLDTSSTATGAPVYAVTGSSNAAPPASKSNTFFYAVIFIGGLFALKSIKG